MQLRIHAGLRVESAPKQIETSKYNLVRSLQPNYPSLVETFSPEMQGKLRPYSSQIYTAVEIFTFNLL